MVCNSRRILVSLGLDKNDLKLSSCADVDDLVVLISLCTSLYGVLGKEYFLLLLRYLLDFVILLRLSE